MIMMGLLEFKYFEAQDVHTTAHQSSLSTIARPLTYCLNGDWTNSVKRNRQLGCTTSCGSAVGSRGVVLKTAQIEFLGPESPLEELGLAIIVTA